MNRQFYQMHFVIPLLYLLFVYILFSTTNLDIWVSNLFYDPTINGFPLRHDATFTFIAHRLPKLIAEIFTLLAVLAFIASFKVEKLSPWRRMFAFVSLSMLMGIELIGPLKKLMNTHCPYDLQMYGGDQPHVLFYESSVAAGQTRPGRCFPAHHVSVGYAFMCLYFVWYHFKRHWAFIALGFALLYGFILGFTRLMQGAHFVWHNMWSAPLVWYIILVLYLIIRPDRSFLLHEQQVRSSTGIVSAS